MATIPEPTADQLQLQVLNGNDRFVAWAPVADLDSLLTAAEARMGIAPSDRTDELRQMSLRVHVVSALSKRETSEADFTQWIAATVMWLTFRHYQHGGTLRRVLDERAAKGRPSILSVGIGDLPAAHMGTAWTFHIDYGVIDARAALATANGVVITEGRS